MGLSGRRVNLPGLLERFGLIIAFALVMILFGSLMPETFLTFANISTVLGSQAVLVVLTLALILPLTTDEFDLSTASVLSLSAMIVALLNAQMKINLAWSLLAALGMGLAVGLINSFFIINIGIHSLIVTLGVGTFINGIVLWISGSQTIAGISFTLINAMIIYRLFGIPLSFFYALALCMVIWYIFQYTSLGRRLLFVGKGREVSRLTGIRVDRVRRGALVASGMISALAGIFYVGTTGAADPSSGLTFLLPAFAAAFFGSTAITPGRFNPIGSIIAVYFLAFGISGLTIRGIETYVQNLFYGGALVLAVTMSTLIKKRKTAD